MRANDGDDEVDPLQAALDEAQSLMESLGDDAAQTTATGDGASTGLAPSANGDDDDDLEAFVVTGGSFAIDSDDDEEEEEEEEGVDEKVNAHPLADDFLRQQTCAAEEAPPAAPTPPPSQASSASGPSMDLLKQQTGRWAAGVMSMARTVSHEVSRGVSTAAESVQGSVAPAAAAPTRHLSLQGFASVGGGTTTTQPQQQHIPATELDREQKDLLIKQHVGALLPGERVMMFLQHLLHVSDSTGFSYSATSAPTPSPPPAAAAVQWCCVVTYYRVLLFAVGRAGPAAPSERPASWHPAAWPEPKTATVLQMPLAACERVEKTVFATPTTARTGGSSSMGGSPAAIMNGQSVIQAAPSTTTVMGLVLSEKLGGRQLRFCTAQYADTVRAYEALQNYAFPGRRNLGYLFAFESKRDAVLASVVTDDATGQRTVTLQPHRRRYEPTAEFQRQLAAHTACPWSLWTGVNQNYQLCKSYPAVLAGPASLDSQDGSQVLRQCAAFRSEHRLPALTWASSQSGACIFRCSQPKIGLQGNRSAADELYVRHILERAAAANAACPSQDPPLSHAVLQRLTGSTDLQPWLPEAGCGLKILDMRPRAAAMANRTGGYGYENTANYAGCTLQFCNIGNIHAVRDSFQKLSAVCLSANQSDLNWVSAVEDTKWLMHVRLILAASWETAYWVHVHRLPVLLHCSHGWDRTSQVAALAQMLLDPYYRTREGFSCLLEKDFCAFGHPFHLRCGHGEARKESTSQAGQSAANTLASSFTGAAKQAAAQQSDEGQISPIFLQFVDAAYQIVQQYPECFEFNTEYLLQLSEHIYSCRFGTFLCDTERERERVAGIRQRTDSVWDYLDGEWATKTTNTYYDPQPGVLLMPLPSLLRNVTLWMERHCRYAPKPTSRRPTAAVPKSAASSSTSSVDVEANPTIHEQAPVMPTPTQTTVGETMAAAPPEKVEPVEMNGPGSDGVPS
jgi:myotubularin-related protein 1/2